jgi:hypothetical protein
MSNHPSKGISVNIEIGEGYSASPRVQAAIAELGAALREAHSDEDVAGFAAFELKDVLVSSVTQKLEASWAPGGTLKTQALSNNEVIQGTFKF